MSLKKTFERGFNEAKCPVLRGSAGMCDKVQLLTIIVAEDKSQQEDK